MCIQFRQFFLSINFVHKWNRKSTWYCNFIRRRRDRKLSWGGIFGMVRCTDEMENLWQVCSPLSHFLMQRYQRSLVHCVDGELCVYLSGKRTEKCRFCYGICSTSCWNTLKLTELSTKLVHFCCLLINTKAVHSPSVEKYRLSSSIHYATCSSFYVAVDSRRHRDSM